MEFRILGDIEVSDDGREIALGGPKQRALLAILLLRTNETVSRDRLIDELWGERPPASAAHTLDSYVHRLRRALGSDGAGRLRTRGGGYQLQVSAGELDLNRFQQAAAEGARALEGGSYERAANKLAAALAIWRGPPLADLDHEPFARVELDRLEELRLAALEDRIEADLALGRHASTVAELRALVAEHPLRDRFRSQLMLALYRSGRQADALEVYQEAREYMVGELGIEPGQQLQDLNSAILGQDEALRAEGGEGSVLTAIEAPELAPPAPPQADPPPRPAAPRTSGEPSGHGASRRGWAPLVIGLGAVAAIAIVIGLIVGGSDGLDAAAIAANAAVLVDTGDGELSSQTAIGGRPTAVVAGGDAVWIANQSARELVRLDRATWDVVDRIPLDSDPDSLALADGQLWVASASEGEVYEVDADADRVVAQIAVGPGPVGIAAGEGAVWVADSVDGTVRRLDPDRARVTQTIDTGEALSGVATGLGAVWAASAETGVLIRIDPESGREIDSVPVGNGPSAVAVGGGAVWVSNPPDGTVTRLDPASGELRKVIVDDPGTLAVAGDSLWVAEAQGTALTAVGLASATVGRRIQAGSPATALAASGEDLVAVTGAAVSAHRGGTLRLVGGGTPASVDPGKAFDLAAFELLALTHQGLITYAREAGPAGTELVPALATSVPEPGDDGRSYTFQLRAGVRYSTGEDVDPLDFRTALERQYARTKGVAIFGTPLVGAQGCLRAPDSCDLSDGIEVNEGTRTITYHLTKPDPAFPFVIALPFGAPVPAGSPPIDAGEQPLPATGPYEIESYVRGESVALVRNPEFEGSDEGFVDRIEAELGVDPQKQTAMVQANTADLALDAPPTDQVAQLLRGDPLRTYAYPSPTDVAMALNTRVPPFDNVDARRAVNYAVDRGAIVRMAGGAQFSRPTCQILPAGFPGFAPYCPYTAGPSAAGVWRAPDLERARQLVQASGTTGASVLVASDADDPLQARIARYFGDLLDRLGYHATVRIYPDSEAYFTRMFGLSDDPAEPISAGTFVWIADYPAPSDFFVPLFSCAAAAPGQVEGATNVSGFCDRPIDARIKAAAAAEGSDRLSEPAFQDLDRRVTDAAPWVPLINPRSVDYIGARVGNYQRNPQVGSLFDRVWVR